MKINATEDLVNAGLPVWTIAASTWAVCTILWSIFTPPHETYVARILLFQPLWLLRMYNGNSTWVQDLYLVLVLHAFYTFQVGIWRIPTLSTKSNTNTGIDILEIYTRVFSLLAACGILAGAIVYRGMQLKAVGKTPQKHLREQKIDEQLIPPLLIKSETTHARLFPQKHSFKYSYFLVGVPVGRSGKISSAFSVDSNRKGWFDVNAADYLERSQEPKDLQEKLRAYLHTQGVTDHDYSFAYLVTAPRFGGYNFNPVSFWYLYDSDTSLKYMILEVNNTFDERRMYFLRGAGSQTDSDVELAEQTQEDNDVATKKITFVETWEKDFHVSPFNSRKGSYSLRAVDPLAAYSETGSFTFDNTIVLRSSKDSAKIVARIYSTGSPMDAIRTRGLQLARLVCAWWWVGFATFPRIAWQARKLYFQRKLHVWFRPEVTQSSIGRTYTNDERKLEAFFEAYLTNIVRRSETPLRLQYRSAHHDGDDITMFSQGFTYEEAHKRTLIIHVQSPAFYSRLVHYAHIKEALDRECLATDDKNKTVFIERADLLPVFFEATKKHGHAASIAQRRLLMKPLEALRWRILWWLRCPPAAASYPHNSDYTVKDIRSFQSSELDDFVLSRCSDSNVYGRIVIKLFLAQRLFLGLPVVVEVLDWSLRALMVYSTIVFCKGTEAFDVFRREHMRHPGSAEVLSTLLLANLSHIWAIVKG